MKSSSRGDARGGAPERDPRGTKPRVLKVDPVTLIDGEGALHLRIEGDRVGVATLRVSEAARFTPELLVGRQRDEAPDLSSRVCGGCAVSHQLTAVKAVESACGVSVDGPLLSLRRLLACGDLIGSHALHVTLRDGPGFLGLDSVFAMSKELPGLVSRALSLGKAGSAVVTAIGGRRVHPVNVRVGGFHRVPTRRELAPLAAELAEARPIAEELLSWAGSLRFPEHAGRHDFVALSRGEGAPSGEGRLVSSGGLDVPVDRLEDHLVEQRVAWSTAPHGRPRAGGTWAVGPLARYNLGYGRLPPAIREAGRRAGLAPPPLANPFRSIVVRALEALWAVDEALRLLGSYAAPGSPSVPVPPRAGVGAAASEAPRGVLYHRYRIGADGLIEEARIVSPTVLNLPALEDDLSAFAAAHLDLPQERLSWQCAQLVRSHDPCLPCAAC